MQKKILIVDDDVSILRVLQRVLEKNGYGVDVAETAAEALGKLRSRRYDLALIDVILPDMKGTDLLVEAKKELTRTVKFIITGYPSGEIGAKARDEGADAFILKPVQMSELLATIRAFLDEEETPYLKGEDKKLSMSEVNGALAK